MSDAETAPKSALLIHPNGWVTLAVGDGREVSLRPPTVGQFRQIRDAYAAAEEEQRASEDLLPRLTTGQVKIIDVDSATLGKGDEPSPGAVAFSAMLDVIGSTGCRADDLPPWAAQTSIYLVLATLWRNVPIVRTGLSDSEKPVVVQPHFDAPDAPPVPADDVSGEAPRWPVDPTGGLQPGPVRTPQRA